MPVSNEIKKHRNGMKNSADILKQNMMLLEAKLLGWEVWVIRELIGGPIVCLKHI
jgi:hypothetical protein